jgi:myo-inositol-1(or 4)-monophosphatase
MGYASEVIPVLTDIEAEVDEILRSYFYSGNFNVRFKEDQTPVTTADAHAQRVIITRLKQAFPKIPVVGEERAEAINRRVKSGYYFIIDPLDGTMNFTMRFPVFAVSIGLYRNNTPVAGAVSYPLVKETYTAVRGRGAYYNGTLITSMHPHRAIDLQDATVSGFIKSLDPGTQRKVMDGIIMRSRHHRSIGAAALELCWQAIGRVDCMISAHLKMWDMAAGALVLEEAGGRWSQFNGKTPVFPSLESYRICSANTPELHRRILDSLR